ncbi:MAG TPA: HrpD5 family protein [Trinickia sp.]|jgi:type III secretion protein D|nr:HrpD5 family protein [Trinickia sp.]
MKALRVLTGIHAGAQVRLTSGTYRVSAAEDADVCISDWQVDELSLRIDENGVTRLSPGYGGEVLVADFVAVPFGDVVFCVGPDDTEWPRDLDLLAGLWKTAEPATPEAGEAAQQSMTDDEHASHETLLPLTARRVTWRTAAVALACTAGIGALMTAGVMLAGTQTSEAASVKVDTNALSKALDEALHREGFADLYSSSRGGSLVVRGMVSSPDESAKVQRIMDGIARGKVRREYDVAQQDIDNIQQSLAGMGAAVSYAGHGVFQVTGNVPSMTDFRARIAEVRADLDSNVKRLDVDVKEARLPVPDAEYTEVVATDALRYIETPDGTKHLFATTSGNDHTN